MPLATKGTTKKTFISRDEAIEWAQKQYGGKDAENAAELARFRLIAGNVPREFWTDTAKYKKVEAHFDADGAISEFKAIDKDGDMVRQYP
jgi:hypothetical protein